MWSSDMKAEISTVVDEYLPGIMTAQERIEDADGADAESLEAAKTAMIVEYVDELERRLQTTVDNVMAESTESVFLKTLAPALQGHMSAVATELSKANIVSDEAAEEAAVQAAMNDWPLPPSRPPQKPDGAGAPLGGCVRDDKAL